MIGIEWVVPIVLLFLGIGLKLGGSSSERNWQSECIKRNVARYHPQTGKWEWTVEDKK